MTTSEAPVNISSLGREPTLWNRPLDGDTPGAWAIRMASFYAAGHPGALARLDAIEHDAEEAFR